MGDAAKRIGSRPVPNVVIACRISAHQRCSIAAMIQVFLPESKKRIDMISSTITTGLWPWWYGMVALNMAQVAVCIHLYRCSLQAPDTHRPYVKRMRMMGLVFTLVACYRAIFVSRYLYQYAWFDTVLNSSLLIRLFAWCAELSFSGLIAFAMLRFNKDLPAQNPPSNRISAFVRTQSPYILMACIFAAQFFATAGLITKSRLAFAIEETLWSVGFLSILPLAYIQFRRVFAVTDETMAERLSMLKGFAIVNLSWCIIYCSYGLVYHLPTEYWVSAFEQIETGVPEIKLGFGAVFEAFRVVHVTHDYSKWGFGFIFWHTAYFSVCVWISLFLMRAPRIRAENENELKR
jgi:hypothetical protein